MNKRILKKQLKLNRHLKKEYKILKAKADAVDLLDSILPNEN